MIRLNVNGKQHDIDVEPDTPLLWAFRENVGLPEQNTVAASRNAAPAPCISTAWPMRSCSLPVSEAVDKNIITIEGLAQNSNRIRCSRPGLKLDVPQCGYCQSGMIMAAAALLKDKPKPTDADIDEAITNICRCGTYNRVRAGDPRRSDQGVREDDHELSCRRSIAAPFSPAPLPLAGSAVGFNIPFADEAPPQTALPPEINAWVVIKPDDTVVIRIARVEMGQGTLTGLAQLVAEELECDWSKVTTEYPTPGANLARNRIWGNFQTARQPGHPPVAEVCPRRRRRRAHHADPGGGQRVEGAGLRMHGRQGRHHAQGRPAARRPTARSPTPPASCEVPKEPALKDPKDWKIAGKPVKRLDTPDKVTGKQVYGIDITPARHAQRRDQAISGDRRQGEELRRRQGRGHEGRQEGRARRRQRCRRRGRHLVARQDRPRRAADRLGRRRSAKVSSADDRRDAEGGPRRPSRPSSATSRATPKRRSLLPPRRSRRSTPSVPEPRAAWSR